LQLLGRVREVRRGEGEEGMDNDAAWMKTLSRSESNTAFQEFRDKVPWTRQRMQGETQKDTQVEGETG
jgi:hypothetical protein